MAKKEEIKKLNKLRDLSNSEGGKELIASHKELLINLTSEIINSYSTKSHIELISVCAKLSANMGIYQLLTGIESQIEAIEALYEEQAP
jgi:hypothetical protein